MKNILVPIIFVVVFGGVIVFVIISAIRRREITFQGKVIDKDVVETQVNNMNNEGVSFGSGGVKHEYKIKVQTDSGKTIKYKISQGMYEVVNIGDTVSKAAGTTEIQIISSVSNPPTSNINNQNPPVNPIV